MTQPELPVFAANASQPGVPTVHSFSIKPVPAPVIRRAIAFVIDFGGTIALTVAVVWWCVALGFEGYDGGGRGGNGFFVVAGFLAIFGIPLGSVIVNVVLAHSRQYSIGKFLVRIRVVDARNHGRPGVGSLLGRSAILFVPGVFSALAVAVMIRFLLAVADGAEPTLGVGFIIVPVLWIGMLVPMLRGDRRGWQDKAAGTRVLTAASVRSV